MYKLIHNVQTGNQYSVNKVKCLNTDSQKVLKDLFKEMCLQLIYKWSKLWFDILQILHIIV